ncbi:transglutaminase family protein, partial [Paenibacillus pasadenensis]|uniref:transglutaminase-like domain-containing protein n=1 Tax=Paenibacillus pasadenensis TaxID=217090 RepID=UPI002042312A
MTGKHGAEKGASTDNGVIIWAADQASGKAANGKSQGAAGQASPPLTSTYKDQPGGQLGWPLRMATSLLLLGLLLEWLLPLRQLPQWTDVYSIGVLAIFGAAILLTGTFLLPGRIAVPLRLAAILAGAAWMDGGTQTFGERLAGLPGQLGEDAVLLVTDGPAALSLFGQAFFLLAGLSILLSALQTLLWVRQWGIGLLVPTAIYLCMLNQWFGLDTVPNLARAAAEGLLLSALLSYDRLERTLAETGKASAVRSPRKSVRGKIELRWWAAAVAAAVLIPLAAAFPAWDKPRPEAPAQWAASVQQTIREGVSDSYGQKEAGSAPVWAGQPDSAGAGLPAGAAFTGYSGSDTRLGAPLRLSREPMFWAVSPQPLYWRMETKSAYTGQGWREDTRELMTKPVGGSERDMDALKKERQFAMWGQTGVISQTVWMANAEQGIPLPVSGVDSVLLEAQPGGGEQYMQAFGGGAIFWPDAAGKPLLYTVESRYTAFSADALRGLKNTASEDSGVEKNAAGDVLQGSGVFSSDGEKAELDRASRENDAAGSAGVSGGTSAVFASARAGEGVENEQLALQLKANLQLPSALPERVRQLAAKIAADAGESRYEKAVAIRDFLKSGYRYSLTDTRVPEAGEDLVDQFLFQQKTGYCVHFSSAMAVMLRAVDIPARWVKGFAPGMAVDMNQAPEKAQQALTAGLAAAADAKLYQVGAADAHAWVEVYFPGAGWVPFDPTPGYAAGAEQAASVPPPALEGVSGGGEAAGEAPRGAGAAGPALAERLREAAAGAARLAAGLGGAAAQPGPAAAGAALAAAAAALASPALRGRLR